MPLLHCPRSLLAWWVSLDTTSSSTWLGWIGVRSHCSGQSAGECSALRFRSWSGQTQMVVQFCHFLGKAGGVGSQDTPLPLAAAGEHERSQHLWLCAHTDEALSHSVSETHRHAQSIHCHTTFLRPASVPSHLHSPAALLQQGKAVHSYFKS